MMRSNVVVVVHGLWVAWIVGWFVASRWTAENVERASTTWRVADRILFAAGAILLFAPLGTPDIIAPTAALAWTGACVTAAGLAFTTWARIHLGRYWSSAAALKSNHALIRSGPYRLARHPIYTGLLIALTGTALVTPTVGAAVALPLFIAGCLVKIHAEETLLTRRFGQEYVDYRREVRALIPFLW